MGYGRNFLLVDFQLLELRRFLLKRLGATMKDSSIAVKLDE